MEHAPIDHDRSASTVIAEGPMKWFASSHRPWPGGISSRWRQEPADRLARRGARGVVFSLTLLLLGCTPVPGAAVEDSPGDTRNGGSGQATTVELDVYSGRPNPEWSLSTTDDQRFADLLSKAPAARSSELASPLGYRGFIVMDRSGTTTRVLDGVIEVSDDQGVVYRTDPDRELERWLLGTGRANLGNELYALVAQELSR